jgi:predicted PurR-regulated permease PerM
LLGLWVAIADLIPLVGASLGALPAMIVAFIHSVPAGVIVTLYFIAYQQIENHVLQPFVYGRTIQLNPFVVLLSVIVGVELAGFLGALFALPVAGAVQVILDHSMGQHHDPESAPLPVESSQGDEPAARSPAR